MEKNQEEGNLIDKSSEDSAVKTQSLYEENQQLCSLCKAEKRDYSENSLSAICASCRKKHTKLSIPKGVKLFLLGLCLLFVVLIARLPLSTKNYQTYVRADRNLAAREYVSAYRKYSTLLKTYGHSLPLAIKTTKAAMGAQYFYEASEVINNYIAGKSLSEYDYNTIESYIAFLESTYTTLEKMMPLEQETKIFTKEEDAAIARASFQEKWEELLDEPFLDKTYLYSYLAMVAQEPGEIQEYYRLAVENRSRFATYPYSQYGAAVRRGGDLIKAREAYETVLDLNREDVDALRGLAIVNLLEGNKQEALSLVQKGYDIDSAATYIQETLIIVLRENGLQTQADSLLASLVAEGFEIDEGFKSYLDGNTDIKTYYID